MIRVALAVVLSTALLATSLPAVDGARRDHTETTLRTEIATIERAVDELVAMDDPIPRPGARRVVTLLIPARSWSHAGVDEVSIASGTGGDRGRIEWSVEGRPLRTTPIESAAIRTPAGEPISLRGSGRHRLVLALAGTATDPVVTVRRFNPEEGATGDHDRLARTRRTGAIG